MSLNSEMWMEIKAKRMGVKNKDTFCAITNILLFVIRSPDMNLNTRCIAEQNEAVREGTQVYTLKSPCSQ